MTNAARVEKRYEIAKEIFEEYNINVEAAMEKCNQIPISINCWQGDDGIGFDGASSLQGGILATGNYPGRATTPEELRADLSEAFSLIPGAKKLNLHACYANKGNRIVDRDEYDVELFRDWIDFVKKEKIGMDFNPTFYSHSKYPSVMTLSSTDDTCRRFWIEHGKRCREISYEFAKEIGQPCVVNFWMPDGYKDTPADTLSPRQRMTESLDEIFEKKYDENMVCDAIESKLFGIGVESYTVASHEFSYGYAITRNKAYCLDAGHFHPTETISSKLSAVSNYCNKLLIHVSRGVRWDSDHVVTLDEELKNIMREIVVNGLENRVNIALDFFDASINRVMAWAIGTRNARKAILFACLEPSAVVRKFELQGDFSARLAMMEEMKDLPYAAVWDYYCMKQGYPVGTEWIQDAKKYESQCIENKRGE